MPGEMCNRFTAGHFGQKRGFGRRDTVASVSSDMIRPSFFLLAVVVALLYPSTDASRRHHEHLRGRQHRLLLTRRHQHQRHQDVFLGPFHSGQNGILEDEEEEVAAAAVEEGGGDGAGKQVGEAQGLAAVEQGELAETSSCPSCAADRELLKNFTRAEIRDRILRKLGMAHAPNVSTEAVPMRLVRQLLSRYRHHLADRDRERGMQGDQPHQHESDDGDDDFHFQTRQINIIAQDAPQPGSPYASLSSSPSLWPWRVQHFWLEERTLRSLWRQMTRARLWVHLPRAEQRIWQEEEDGEEKGEEDEEEVEEEKEGEHAWINLFYVSVDKNGHVFLTQEAATKVRLREDRDGWAELDVWDVVSLWFKHPDTNLGLVIQVSTSSGKEISVGVQEQPETAPFLQLDIQESVVNNRRKRTLNKVCTEERDAAETHCCLWPITIDFEREFGWKWIIHPPKYEANYCAGDCSLGVMMPSNPYSHLLQQANGNPCCAPQKMSGMNMLYMDENKNVILGKLPNMRVDRCGCI